MEINTVQLISTVVVEMLTLALLCLIGLSPLGMFIWMAIHPERYENELKQKPVIKHHHKHTRSHVAHLHPSH